LFARAPVDEVRPKETSADRIEAALNAFSTDQAGTKDDGSATHCVSL